MLKRQNRFQVKKTGLHPRQEISMTLEASRSNCSVFNNCEEKWFSFLILFLNLYIAKPTSQCCSSSPLLWLRVNNPFLCPFTAHWETTQRHKVNSGSDLSAVALLLPDALLVHVNTSQMPSPPSPEQKKHRKALLSKYRSDTHELPCGSRSWPSLMIAASCRADWKILDPGVGEKSS